MTEGTIAQRAFIELRIDPENWDLPDEFDEALGKYVDSVPTLYYLPWPPTMLPWKGATIFFNGIPVATDEVAVEKIDFQYTKAKGVEAFIVTAHNWRPQDFDLQTLHAFAAEGVLIENMTKSLKEVLEEAGLWQQLVENYGS